jgi:hypothetical protein
MIWIITPIGVLLLCTYFDVILALQWLVGSFWPFELVIEHPNVLGMTWHGSS